MGETKMTEARKLFDRCVVRKSKGSRYEIKCRLGLWGVEGPDLEAAEKEAIRYWIQYFLDGEYHKHLFMSKQRKFYKTRIVTEVLSKDENEDRH